ncbi:hypothetical protein N865_19020 [Intrasporangium oryzae NRRL B-24470]|uniref:GmrSD restriction endonucleases C-terminal domain-containing protein n=1 Tax=Intrasporangium oryzae NRRL B-24470 TaxID=1386089 RepID=W9GEQ4_9MICO|nr:HNH endonuclease family protein [Intrasporangium oryzae]EWT03313.1 hypothetical protein N865_19020 [Intrasporangium oryzae NRRL B-24470]
MSRLRLVFIAVLLGAALATPSISRAIPQLEDLVRGATQAASSSSAAPTSTPTSGPPTTAPSGASPGTAGSALATVATLTVKGRAPQTGYERDRFGQAWLDTDHNGCDTRNDVLRRDLAHVEVRAGTHGCVVLRGTLKDPYTGRTIEFVRGASTSAAVQIDHVVALSDAWQKGAQGLSDATRAALANDPLNLLAVDGPTNQAKGDGDTATWLPPAKGYRCAYVARQVAVKAKYHLWVTAAERDAMRRVLATCPTQPLPAPSSVAVPAPAA